MKGNTEFSPRTSDGKSTDQRRRDTMFVVLWLLASGLVTSLNAWQNNLPPFPQDNKPAASGMVGANPQRTRVYNSSPISEPKSLIWKTGKLFVTDRSYPTIVTLMGAPGNPWWVDSTSSRHRFTEPIIGAGTIYFSLYINDGYVYAQDGLTGQDKWRFKLKSRSFSPIAAADGVVFVGANDGTFYALNAGTGEELWKKIQKGDSFYTAAPAASGSIVLFSSTESPGVMNVRPDGRLFALEAKTGNELWLFKTKAVLTAPAIAGSTVVVGDTEGYLWALDVKTGQQQWKFKSSGGDVWNPSIEDGTVYFATQDGSLHAVDVVTGQEKWKSAKTPKVGTMLAVAHGTVYYGGQDKNLYAMDARSGQLKWEYKTAKQIRSPVLAGGLIYFPTLDGIMFALDADTGEEKWKMNNLSPYTSIPVIENGVFYFLNLDGHIYALR